MAITELDMDGLGQILRGRGFSRLGMLGLRLIAKGLVMWNVGAEFPRHSQIRTGGVDSEPKAYGSSGLPDPVLRELCRNRDGESDGQGL